MAVLVHLPTSGDIQEAGVTAMSHACSIMLHLCAAPHSNCMFYILTVCLQLHPDKQRAIAEELDRNPGEVLKKIEDIRNKIL